MNLFFYFYLFICFFNSFCNSSIFHSTNCCSIRHTVSQFLDLQTKLLGVAAWVSDINLVIITNRASPWRKVMSFPQDPLRLVRKSANCCHNIWSFQLHVFYHFSDCNSLFLFYNFQKFFGENFCGTDGVSK